MIVTLTTRQLEVVSRAFTERDMDWVNDVWLWNAKPLPGHTTTMEVVMPAVGWWRAMRLLIELTVGPLGGNRPDVKRAALNARNRIAAEVARYSAHPALYGLGMVGQFYDVIPAWLTGATPPGLLYDVLPNGATFVHLLPERDGEFTVWHAQHVLPTGLTGSVLDEDEHLRFTVRGSQRDGLASGR